MADEIATSVLLAREGDQYLNFDDGTWRRHAVDKLPGGEETQVEVRLDELWQGPRRRFLLSIPEPRLLEQDTLRLIGATRYRDVYARRHYARFAFLFHRQPNGGYSATRVEDPPLPAALLLARE